MYYGLTTIHVMKNTLKILNRRCTLSLPYFDANLEAMRQRTRGLTTILHQISHYDIRETANAINYTLNYDVFQSNIVINHMTYKCIKLPATNLHICQNVAHAIP